MDESKCLIDFYDAVTSSPWSIRYDVIIFPALLGILPRLIDPSIASWLAGLFRFNPAKPNKKQKKHKKKKKMKKKNRSMADVTVTSRYHAWPRICSIPSSVIHPSWINKDRRGIISFRSCPKNNPKNNLPVPPVLLVLLLSSDHVVVGVTERSQMETRDQHFY